MPKMTSKMLAELCGVSRGTIDRVVNRRAGVAPDVRARVEKAIAKTGYRTPTARRTQGSHTDIGFLIAPHENRYYAEELKRGIRRAKRGIFQENLHILVEEVAEDTARAYRQALSRLLEQGVQGIILNAGDVPALRPELDALSAQGIQLVTYDSDLEGTSRLCHIGQDDYRAGRMAAGLMLRLTSSASDILVVTGNLDHSTHRGRVDGFCKRVSEQGLSAPRTKVVECFESYEKTYETVLHNLQENPRLRGIYMATESVDACVHALEKAKSSAHIALICNDLTPWAKGYLLTGVVDYIIDQEFSHLAERSILILYEYLFRQKQPHAQVEYIRTRIVSRELVEPLG